MNDLKFALRTLRKSPGFTLVAALTLALGIGATVAVFSVVNGVLLAPLPYRDPGRLVMVNHYYPSLNNLRASVSAPGFRDYRALTDVFQYAAVQRGAGMNLTGTGDPERINAITVAGDYFTTLGVEPTLGRALRPDDAENGGNDVAVLTWPFFQRRFGGDSSVVGRSIVLNDVSYRVVGVTPPSYRDFFSGRTDLIIPLVFRPADFADNRRTFESLAFIARLVPGVSVEAAQARLHVEAAQLRAGYPNQYASDWDLLVTSFTAAASRGIRAGLLILLGAVGLVLLIACANVANLLLARMASRTRDVAVRVALGASPHRLARLVLTESLVLAIGGGALGVLLAVWGVPALLALNGAGLPPTAHVAVNLPVLGFALAVSLGTGVLFGFAPALHVLRAQLHETLKEGGRAIGDRGGLALRRGLVVSTVALALTLLVGASLLLRSFARIVDVDPGFRPDHLLTFRISLPAAKYANDTLRTDAMLRLAAALRAVPGVADVGGTSNMPFGGSFSTASFNVEGYQPPPNAPMPWGDMRTVTPGFLPAMGARLIAGRLFTDADRAGAPAVCIVDDELVHRFWPDEDPIGKRITFNDLSDSSIAWIQVVGVVHHLAHEGLDAQKRVQVYFALPQNPRPFLDFAVRTQGPPLAAVAAVGAAVRSVDPDLPLAGVRTMDDLIGDSLGARRFALVLLGGFAFLALALASIGLYGVMSYTVTQRVRELGVRLALGAGRGQVLALVLSQGARLALLGAAIGLAAALALTRVMTSMLYGIGATDPVVFVATPCILIAVALAASYLPARRATRLDPVEALRYE
jgi:putative ABC transport system permease protein